MNLVITGYYKQSNLGDDLFEYIAKQIFKKNIVPIDIINLYNTCDRVILFGGETLNNYFLDKLIKLWKLNKNIKFVAIGVSCNQNYNEVLNKIQLFESISFRSKKDYNYFKNYIQSYYYPDIVFTYPKQITLCRKYIGFFLSQTAIAHKNENDKSYYINNLVIFIKYLISKNYNIYLFSMCDNFKITEDDTIINTYILECLDICDKKYITFFNSNKLILENIKRVKYSICWRYHAHILSIIYNIPFISLSNTPKVIDLLNEINLSHLSTNIENLQNKMDEIIQNKNNIKRKLKCIYKSYYKQTQIYKKPNLYYLNKNENTFYIEPELYNSIYNYLINIYNELKIFNDNWFNALIITFYFTKSLNNDYTYGLSQKIHLGLNKLKDDIYWLINDCILQKNLYFYESIIETFNIKSSKTGIINIRYINQYDYMGLHRSGWEYVLNNLEKYHNSNSILCDLYVDRTFHWNCGDYSILKVIPYKKPWIGFIHHTTNINFPNNATELFKNKLFIESLEHCKGLITLSKYLKNDIEKLLNNYNINVYNLVHPTEFVNNVFTIDKFIKNKERKIIQIGAWMRNLNAINMLNLNDNILNLQKVVLCGKKMEHYFENIDIDNCMCRDGSPPKIILNSDVIKLSHINNDMYDNLLTNNIVFINLIDASAVNTVIECIVRNTPIIINKLPALVEILGSTYPLFYDNIDDIYLLLNLKTIKNGFNYLKKLNKKDLKIETFITNLTNIINSV